MSVRDDPCRVRVRAAPELIQRGREIAETGNAAKGLPACNACYGAGGAGESPTIPYLTDCVETVAKRTGRKRTQ